ncbi:ScyD/ScyE family protein [Streptomyces caniscabiei]|uniref:ScyD/ScyE family protein n=1 Tax=Streptomyces caniscabiei TaxID=2746961 RepID=A0A927LBK6_9ACTN|nr:ScyD/ScyE family protein [Streptomyces caniscabiei]MBD9729322.1 ScyD/ScyE family protein [Streptomyces caniscabiei]MDX3514988.1 ScyD/ScyE family protein [Streptomyces caniscabiei]MDX3724392.1 ScyD/ScyE family protein [Streptomyces caniscabiei]
MSISRRSWRTGLMTAAAAAAVAAPVLTAPAAHADTATIEVIADHLKNPRGITVLSDGTILVAEAGEGLPGCAEGQSCVGRTGGVYKVKGDAKGRVVTGLASHAEGVAAGAPVSATGPTDVVPDPRGGYDVVSNLGGTTDYRDSLGPDAATLGTVFRTRDGKILGDLAAHETRLNPDAGEVHANPWGLIRSGSGFLVTDAGSNDIVRVHGDGTTSTDFLVPVNVTPVRTAEAVPTGIVRAKDGTVYFADMSGMVAGSARIWKAVPGQQPEVLVTGLTNLIDLAVDCQGDLLALSFTEGFQAGPPLPAKLSKIDTAARTVTEIPTGGRLNQPTGLAVGPRNQVYVTNNAHSADGQLVRVRY